MVSVDTGQNRNEETVAQISAAIDRGDLSNAGRLSNQAINQGLRHPIVFNARGLALQASGYHQEALKDFEAAAAMLPRNPTLLNAMGVSLLSLTRVPEALKHFDAALAVDPRHAPSHFRRGLAQALLGDHDLAETSYKKALALDPNHADAIASLASIAARKRQNELARQLAQRALSLKPGDPTATYALAMVDNAERNHEGAEAKLRAMLSDARIRPQSRAGALGLLGDALDGQGRYDEAFECYVKENAELRQGSAGQFAEGSRAADSVRHLTDYFRTADAAQWVNSGSDAEADGGTAQHIFLLGFMCSGTTLLEQVLASNPNVVATEEKGTLNEPGRVFMTSAEGLDTLASLDDFALRHNRKAYWEHVRKQGVDVKGKVYVDKQPLNTLKLPLIAKLFPKAKVLFALRDPRDVVFSCFRRHFRVNVMMFEFLDLKDSATFYADIMGLAELYRAKLPLNVFEHRYEDMVADFEGRVRAVCDFIGIPWSDSMREFNKLAPAVDLRSPSAAQVRRPLYSEAIGQWRRYAPHLAPALPILAPWVEKFGYPSE